MINAINHSSLQIEGSVHIAFSEGRTSAYILKVFLDAHSGTLPKDCFVIFQNTGRGMPETLDFVTECASHWNIKIHWLEDRPDSFTEVGHNSTAGDGEPFEKRIEKKGGYLCTQKWQRRGYVLFYASLHTLLRL